MNSLFNQWIHCLINELIDQSLIHWVNGPQRLNKKLIGFGRILMHFQYERWVPHKPRIFSMIHSLGTYDGPQTDIPSNRYPLRPRFGSGRALTAPHHGWSSPHSGRPSLAAVGRGRRRTVADRRSWPWVVAVAAPWLTAPDLREQPLNPAGFQNIAWVLKST